METTIALHTPSRRRGRLLTAGLLAAALSLLLSAGRLLGDTVSTSGSFDDVNGGEIFTSDGDPSGVGVYFQDTPVVDLEKFNPSLGELTGVDLVVTYDYEYTLTLFTGQVDDLGQDFEATIELPDLSVFIGYSPGSSNSTWVLAGGYPSAMVTAYGLAGDGSAQDEQWEYNTVEFLEGDEQLDIISGFEAADFIGSGSVDVLSAVITIPVGADFSLVNLLDADAELDVWLYGATVTLVYTYTPHVPGDANNDGVVNIEDFIVLKQNYGSTGASWAQGDFNGDGVVNIEDFIILKQNYGFTSVAN